jgi:taurine--2-oxoglutarate transaminase
MDQSSIFSWGASDGLRPLAVHVDKAEGVYYWDRDGKRYIDWSAGAVCSNLGHTVPESIKKAAID